MEWEEVRLDCQIPPGIEMGQGAVSSGPPMATRHIRQIPNGQKRVKRVGQSVRLSGSKLGQRRGDQVSARRPGARPENSGHQPIVCFGHTHCGVAFIMSSHHRGSYVPSLSHFFLSSCLQHWPDWPLPSTRRTGRAPGWPAAWRVVWPLLGRTCRGLGLVSVSR